MQPMTFKEANRRYLRGFVPVMTFYVLVCFGGPLLLDRLEQPPTWAYALVAVITALPIVVVFWLMARVMRETDEYTRKIQADALLTGGAVTLCIAVVWGFLELYNVVPRSEDFPSMMMVGPAFFLFWGIAYGIQARRR